MFCGLTAANILIDVAQGDSPIFGLVFSPGKTLYSPIPLSLSRAGFVRSPGRLP